MNHLATSKGLALRSGFKLLRCLKDVPKEEALNKKARQVWEAEHRGKPGRWALKVYINVACFQATRKE